MPANELAQLELLSQLDALVERLADVARHAPDWQPAQNCRALIRRLTDRVSTMRVRWEAPLVVAVLGGTGTGKSALVNALLGDEVVKTGRQRPTTCKPAVICRPSITPEMLGVEPADVELITRKLPLLNDLVLVDCPDPDTSESESADDPGKQIAGDNLARLRKILPHCDVLLVTATQQKYRSAKVAQELAAAAAGARLVFVQTHADADADIREDWRGVLAEQYSTGRIFFIDSPTALADAQHGRGPQGEFARLVDLLSQEFAGAARNRIRRANFLDLLAETLDHCRHQLEQAQPAVETVLKEIESQRQSLAALLAEKMHADLIAGRRAWENRLLAQTASQWGISPFALVLRIYQNIGNWALGALIFRAKTPAQIALWGTLEGVKAWRRHRQDKQAVQGLAQAADNCWDQPELSKAAIILDGYAADAGLNRLALDQANLTDESEAAGSRFIARAAADLDSLIARLAERHTGWFTRCFYQIMLLAMIGALLFRAGKNFFYDSWLAPLLELTTQQTPVFGLDFYITAAIWLLLWCLLLLTAFTRRLHRGLRREIDQLSAQWRAADSAAGLFSRLETECRDVRRFREDLDKLAEQVRRLQRQLAMPDDKIGRHL